MTPQTLSSRQRWKEVAILSGISVFTTEIITTSTTLLELTSPITIVFLILGYVLPVLFIREIVVRYELGIVGIFILGFLAGIYSEGILARTLFTDTTSPIDIFAHYGTIAHVRIPWVLTIGSWQSLHAILYPIFILIFLFPKSQTLPYFSVRGMHTIGYLLLIISGIFIFARGQNISIELFFYGSIIGIAFLSIRKFGKRGKITPLVESSKSRNLWKYGVGLYIIFSIIPLLFAKFEVHPILYTFYFFAIFFILIRIQKDRTLYYPEGLSIALSAVICVSIFTALITVPFGLWEQGITAILSVLFSLFCLLKIYVFR